VNEKEFTQYDLEKIYDIVCEELSPIILNIVYLGVVSYLEEKIEENSLFFQQTWEFFRINYGNDVVNTINYVIPPWDMRGILNEQEEELILTLALMLLLHKIYDNTKDNWQTMNIEQKDKLLDNLIGNYM
jgi:hypothetical protein